MEFARLLALRAVIRVEILDNRPKQSLKSVIRDGLKFLSLVLAPLQRVRLDRIVADYDSEPNHAFARRSCGVHSIIPPKDGRPTTKPARGHFRRLMQTRFDEEAYRDRVQVETVISMVKRRLEPCVRGRTVWTQRYELRLKVLTHNVMMPLRIRLFYRAFLIRMALSRI
jgi:hypothetical protein